jgi:hypothetical protein
MCFSIGMRKGLVRATLVGLGMVVLACKSDPILTLTDYDQSCSADADCIVVAEGDVCCCGGTSVAINQKELGRYRTDRDNTLKQGCASGCTEACSSAPPAACQFGTCVVCPYGGCPDAGTLDGGVDSSGD